MRPDGRVFGPGGMPEKRAHEGANVGLRPQQQPLPDGVQEREVALRHHHAPAARAEQGGSRLPALGPGVPPLVLGGGLGPAFDA